MRLLYLADIRFPMERANGIQTAETCHALARAGVRVDLVVRRTDDRSDAACLEFFGLPPHPNLTLRRVGVIAPGTLWGRLSFIAQSIPLLMNRDYDAVYTRDLALAALIFRLRRLHNLPLVYEAHTIASEFSKEVSRLYREGRSGNPRKLKRLKRREGGVWHHAFVVVTITRGLAESLASLHGNREGVVVVPDGARVPSEPVAPKQPDGGPFLVYYIGQLYPWKGVDVLLEAVQHVPEIEAVIVGGLPPEPDLDRTRRSAEHLGIAARVHFRGYLSPPRLAEERARADALVIPLRDTTTGRHFTSPLKLFEAMASGRPIVASALPSIQEILSHEQNALLVSPDDPLALANAIQRLAGDPLLGRRLAAKAAEDVKMYSWDKRAQKIAELLETIPKREHT